MTYQQLGHAESIAADIVQAINIGHIDPGFSIQMVSTKVRLSPRHVNRILIQSVGMSFRRYLRFVAPRTPSKLFHMK
jgi:AraC-like DNA-binding protein